MGSSPSLALQTHVSGPESVRTMNATILKSSSKVMAQFTSSVHRLLLHRQTQVMLASTVMRRVWKSMSGVLRSSTWSRRQCVESMSKYERTAFRPLRREPSGSVDVAGACWMTGSCVVEKNGRSWVEVRFAHRAWRKSSTVERMWSTEVEPIMRGCWGEIMESVPTRQSVYMVPTSYSGRRHMG